MFVEFLFNREEMPPKIIIVNLRSPVKFGIKEIKIKEYSEDIISWKGQEEKEISDCPRKCGEEAKYNPIGQPFFCLA